MQARRARTRRLIELGGLVHKSGLADQLGDDRAAIMGALLTAVRLLNNPGTHRPSAEVIARWREAGRVALNRRDQPNSETL
jgi:Conjugal transfer protein TraD